MTRLLLATLLFHQPMLALLHAVGLTPGTPYAMRAAAVIGVPQFISTAFWGGVWGIALVFLVRRLPGWRPGLGAREVQTPKIYIVDTGMLAYLMGADEQRIANDDQVTGKVVEIVPGVWPCVMYSVIVVSPSVSFWPSVASMSRFGFVPFVLLSSTSQSAGDMMTRVP